jgi:small nuclear ribonucleoprotein (snRNP)-like protein
VLDQIAKLAVNDSSERNLSKPSGNIPMKMLLDFMNSKSRVRVYIRKLNGMRGRIDGELICFDKHFNIVLRNANEEYSLSDGAAKLREDEDCSGSVYSRALPQVLVRGDNVVLVCKSPI